MITIAQITFYSKSSEAIWKLCESLNYRLSFTFETQMKIHTQNRAYQIWSTAAQLYLSDAWKQTSLVLVEAQMCLRDMQEEISQVLKLQANAVVWSVLISVYMWIRA